MMRMPRLHGSRRKEALAFRFFHTHLRLRSSLSFLLSAAACLEVGCGITRQRSFPDLAIGTCATHPFLFCPCETNFAKSRSKNSLEYLARLIVRNLGHYASI